jgi:anti-sigma factor RsiW
VDEKRTDLKAALREIAAEESGDVGPHCGSKRLIAYRQGTLPAAEREAVQEHLSLCPRCTGLLRELRNFETAAARGDSGPEALRQEAWDSLARRLPAKTPAVRPVAVDRLETRRRFSRFAAVAAAALLLAVAGLTLWAAVTVLRKPQRLTRLERRLEERDAENAALRSSLAEVERRLAAASGRIQILEKKRDQIAAASPEIEVSVSPRYVLRGRETPEGGFLRAGGVVNPMRTSRRERRFSVALSLGDRPASGEYRLELVDRDGKALWSARRSGASLLGDAGTSVSVAGLGPGRYRLRIAGPDSREPLAEYLLEVGP